jgi:hypothetical protein
MKKQKTQHIPVLSIYNINQLLGDTTFLEFIHHLIQMNATAVIARNDIILLLATLISTLLF